MTFRTEIDKNKTIIIINKIGLILIIMGSSSFASSLVNKFIGGAFLSCIFIFVGIMLYVGVELVTNTE